MFAMPSLLGPSPSRCCSALPRGRRLGRRVNPDATIRIGSLYEPQNLDNTGGAGQGINEAFNGNVTRPCSS